MGNTELNYFNWIKNLIGLHHSYDKLLEYLWSMRYVVIKDDDQNRLIDGMDLRYEYLYELGISAGSAMEIRDNDMNWNCNVLEMMVALAWKMDQNILYDAEVGDQVYIWFFDMLKSMHIDMMTDDNFDDTYVYKKVTDMMLYNYSSNGDGGLFTINDFPYDIREFTIWYQMMNYLSYKIYKH